MKLKTFYISSGKNIILNDKLNLKQKEKCEFADYLVWNQALIALIVRNIGSD